MGGAYTLLQRYANGGVDHPALTLAFGLSLLRIPLLPEEVRPEQRELLLIAGRAGFHMAQGSSGARRAFEELVSRYPAIANVHYAYGTYLLRVDRDAARREFERELRLSPTHQEAKLQMAFDAITRGRAEEGERSSSWIAPGRRLQRSSVRWRWRRRRTSPCLAPIEGPDVRRTPPASGQSSSGWTGNGARRRSRTCPSRKSARSSSRLYLSRSSIASPR